MWIYTENKLTHLHYINISICKYNRGHDISVIESIQYNTECLLFWELSILNSVYIGDTVLLVVSVCFLVELEIIWFYRAQHRTICVVIEVLVSYAVYRATTRYLSATIQYRLVILCRGNALDLVLERSNIIITFYCIFWKFSMVNMRQLVFK